MENILYFGDNLQILREYIKDNSVDLIYLDPPFKSGKDYNILYKEPDGEKSIAQIKAFEDTWHWSNESEENFDWLIKNSNISLIEFLKNFRRFLGENDIMAYLTMMSIRLLELRRVLKETGSMYLHCDPTASHYLKILMDSIFSTKFFRNEIIWCYRGYEHNKSYYNRKHDVILFYTKTDKYCFNYRNILEPLSEETIKKYKYTDSSGNYRLRGRNIKGSQFKQKTDLSPEDEAKYKDLIYRQYMTDGILPRDWFILDFINQASKERLGYQTQKPLELLKKIILASSNEGEVVLDPFCGCGTTIDAAISTNRKWLGIDITHLAIHLIKKRIKDKYGESIDYKVVGEPTDLAGAIALAQNNKYQFQWWALSLVDARPAEEDRKMGADKGIDGVKYFKDSLDGSTIRKIIIQVKSGNIGVKDIRELITVTDQNDGVMGVLIILNEPTFPMKREAISAGYYFCDYIKQKYPKIQILTIKELFSGKRIEYFNISDATFKVAEKHIDKLFN